MREECIIHDIKDGFAYIGLSRKDNCNGCKACIFGKGKTNIIPAIKDIECKTGDTVVVELAQSEIKFGFIMYLFPIFALFLGFFTGRIFNNEILEAVFALSFCALSFFPIYLIDKKFKKRKYMPAVIEVIQREQNLKENV